MNNKLSNNPDIYYEYMEHDGIYHRLTYQAFTKELLKVEGHFKGSGFLNVEAFPILRGGQSINEAEFKSAIIANR